MKKLNLFMGDLQPNTLNYLEGKPTYNSIDPTWCHMKFGVSEEYIKELSKTNVYLTLNRASGIQKILKNPL